MTLNILYKLTARCWHLQLMFNFLLQSLIRQSRTPPPTTSRATAVARVSEVALPPSRMHREVHVSRLLLSEVCMSSDRKHLNTDTLRKR